MSGRRYTYTHRIMTLPDLPTFRRLAERGNLIALVQRVMSDQLTPVLAYRRLVAPDERTAPSFLLAATRSWARSRSSRSWPGATT